jgi:hypothetical protein
MAAKTPTPTASPRRQGEGVRALRRNDPTNPATREEIMAEAKKEAYAIELVVNDLTEEGRACVEAFEAAWAGGGGKTAEIQDAINKGKKAGVDWAKAIDWGGAGLDALNKNSGELLKIAAGAASHLQCAWWLGRKNWIHKVSPTSALLVRSSLYSSGSAADKATHEAVAEISGRDFPIGPIKSTITNEQNERPFVERWRPAHAAAVFGGVALVKLYLDAGHNANGWDPDSKRAAGGASANETPSSTPLWLACERGGEEGLEIARLLVSRGARSDFPAEGPRPAFWRAGELMARRARETTQEEALSLGWAKLALETLAPQGDEAFTPSGFARGSACATEAMLAIARSARGAARQCARISGGLPVRSALREDDAAQSPKAEEKEKDKESASRSWWSRLFRSEASGDEGAEAVVAVPTDREREFWRALAFVDARALEAWLGKGARAAQKNGSDPRAERVEGLSPAAWIVALCVAEETRARVENRVSALFFRRHAGAGGSCALLAPLAEALGPEAFNEPVGLWGGMSALGAAALCDCPGVAGAMMDLGAGASSGSQASSAQEPWGFLEAAARGQAIHANAKLLEAAARDQRPEWAAALWIGASKPAEAARTLKAGSEERGPEFWAAREAAMGALARQAKESRAKRKEAQASEKELAHWDALLAQTEALILRGQQATADLGAAARAAKMAETGGAPALAASDPSRKAARL